MEHILGTKPFKVEFYPAAVRSWAAYVAGALVVLAHEAGARFGDGAERAGLQRRARGQGRLQQRRARGRHHGAALAAAHGIDLDGRGLALLCQKVRVLGAGLFINIRHTSTVLATGTCEGP